MFGFFTPPARGLPGPGPQQLRPSHGVPGQAGAPTEPQHLAAWLPSFSVTFLPALREAGGSPRALVLGRILPFTGLLATVQGHAGSLCRHFRCGHRGTCRGRSFHQSPFPPRPQRPLGSQICGYRDTATFSRRPENTQWAPLFFPSVLVILVNYWPKGHAVLF